MSPSVSGVGSLAKFLVFLLVIPLYLRFRYRRYPRIVGRLVPWSAMTAGALLLLVAPWSSIDGTASTILAATRVAVALFLLVRLFFEVRAALLAGPTDPKARVGRGRR